MAEGHEQLRIWRRRIWRRRWLCLGVTWAACALGWTAVGLVSAQQTAAAGGVLLSLVLLAGLMAGGLAAALIGGREEMFDSVAELQASFRLPVLGGVPDLARGSRHRAASDLSFALGCLGLIATFAGLLMVQAQGLLPGS